MWRIGGDGMKFAGKKAGGISGLASLGSRQIDYAMTLIQHEDWLGVSAEKCCDVTGARIEEVRWW